MKDGTCPRCKADTIYTQREGISMDTSGVYVRTSSATRASKTDDYICTTCGYFEQYVADAPKLEDVTRKWMKVG